MKFRFAHRAAFTMPEMMISLLVAASLLGLLTATVSRVLIAHGAACEHLENLVSVGRLGEQFRSDVHAAQSATTEPLGAQVRKLRLDLGTDELVEYEIEPAGLRRTLSVDGQIWHREMFVLPGMGVLGWNDDFKTSGRLSLRLGRLPHGSDDSAAPVSEFSIDAAIAADGRLRGE
jgi:prepilin-type N-terminal cleavage/methylation domain-containing protein